MFCRYKVIEILAGGGSALVEWRLETGRTHQVPVELESCVTCVYLVYIIHAHSSLTSEIACKLLNTMSYFITY